MPSTIFSGSKVKTLKDTLNLNGGADVISSTTDPTSAAVNAAAGSLLLNTTSGKLYRKNDAGSTTNWTEVGAGGTGKNYITQGTFDNAATTGWSLASSTLDATSKLPNQASGSWGAAAGTLAISTVGAGSQLAGNYSLSLASSAASTAGNMLVSDALTLDLEAQASIQTFSFFYKIASGSASVNLSGTSSNSIGVAIYDVTNGAWIDPAGRYNVVQSSGVGKASGTFQVPANCTSVRLAVYFPNASSGAFTVYLDDFVLGPQVVQYGAPVTDWQSYTPTYTGQGTATFNATGTGYFFRRIGDSVEIYGRIEVSGAGSGASEFTVSLPSGLSIATSKLTSTGSNDVGRAVTILISPAAMYQVIPASTTSIRFYDAEGTWAGVTGAQLNAGSIIWFRAELPIAGLSSSVQMSNDTDTRVVAARYTTTASNTTLSGASTTLDFNTITYDTHAGGSGGSGSAKVYTIPISGFYRISASVMATTNTYTAGANRNAILQTGGSLSNIAFDLFGIQNTFTGYFTLKGTLVLYYTAGQTVSIVLSNSTGSSISLDPSNNFNYFQVERVSGPSVIAANETVAMRAFKTATQSFSTSTKITGFTRVFDTHGIWDSTLNRINVPISGVYNLIIQATSVPTTTANQVPFYRINNVTSVQIGTDKTSTTSINRFNATANIKLNAGDYVEIFQYTDASVSYQAGDDTSFICFTRLGN